MISMNYKITTGNVEGKECYIFNAKVSEPGMKSEIYIEKETGLVLQVIQILPSLQGEMEFYKEEYEYSFGTVTDEDMQELDATEYILK